MSRVSGTVFHTCQSKGPPLLPSSEIKLELIHSIITVLSELVFSRTHGTEVSRAWSGVQSQQQPCNKDHVVFHKRLRKQKQQEEEDVISVNTRGRLCSRMEMLLSGNNIHLKNIFLTGV